MKRIGSLFVAPLALSALCLAQPVKAEEALFKYQGKTYTSDKLEPKYKVQLHEVLAEAYQKKTQLADEIVLDLYFADQAKKTKKPVEKVREEAYAVKTPTEKDLKSFYEENKGRIPYPYEQVKGELERFVKQQRMMEKREALLKKVKAEGKFAFLEPEPKAPVIELNLDGFASRGNEKSKVTVAEFADYKCPHCGEAEKAFKKVYKKYDDKVRFVFVDYPILSPVSTKVAEGAACAGKLGKYWEYHSAAFENQASLTDASVKELAKKVGVDEKKFADCVDKGEGAAVVAKGKAEGERLGITGTPTIYINGQKKQLAPTEEAISEAIDEALKASKGAS